MRDKEEFYQILLGLQEGAADDFKGLMGDFDFSRYVLRFSQEAQESGEELLVVVRVPQSMAGFPEALYASPLRRTALEDYLTRCAARCLESLQRFDASGVARRRISTVMPGQKILPRTSVAVDANYVEARLYIGLPIREGRINVDAAAELFFQDLPRVVTASFIYHNLPAAEVGQYVRGMETVDAARQLLPTRGWVGFVAQGSRLHREIPSDAPRIGNEVPPFSVHEGIRENLDLRNERAWEGAGIPAGLTVILGDENSGRRELMHALASGIYNHIPGDGRERVVTIADAVYVAAEPGRCIHGVNLTPFCSTDRVDRANAENYAAEHAEAHLAQAASLVEALEAGARALLLDESDSAAAFLSADPRLKKLYGNSENDFVPLCFQARRMVDELGISMVVAGCVTMAPFVPVADAVLVIENGVLRDVTQEAKDLSLPILEPNDRFCGVQGLVDQARCLVPSSIEPGWGRSEANISAEEIDLLVFGDDLVDLSGLRQLAEVAQTATIGTILRYVKTRYLVEPRPMRELLDLVDRDLSTEGLDCLGRDVNGRLARPRRYEIAAVLNRMPSVRVYRDIEQTST